MQLNFIFDFGKLLQESEQKDMALLLLQLTEQFSALLALFPEIAVLTKSFAQQPFAAIGMAATNVLPWEHSVLETRSGALDSAQLRFWDFERET